MPKKISLEAPILLIRIEIDKIERTLAIKRGKWVIKGSYRKALQETQKQFKKAIKILEEADG